MLDIYGDIQMIEGDRDFIPFRFQGQYADVETGLYYNRFRYYSPELGNYISQDPIRMAGNNPTLYGYVKDTNSWLDLLGLMPWPNPIKSGHHLIYAGKARSMGLFHLSDSKTTPTFFFNDPYMPGTHERIHRAQGLYVGPRQGKWNGTVEELFSKSRKGLESLEDIKGSLIIPSTGKVLAENVTPLQAFDKLIEWHVELMSKLNCK